MAELRRKATSPTIEGPSPSDSFPVMIVGYQKFMDVEEVGSSLALSKRESRFDYGHIRFYRLVAQLVEREIVNF